MARTDALRERALRELARRAAPALPVGSHVEDPVLALLHHGDTGEDLNDAVAHVASCADCRARFVEGRIERRNVVVLAMEAPKSSRRTLEKVAERTQARLLERGEGRWSAVVDAFRADDLRVELETTREAHVERLAVTPPFEVVVEGGPVRNARNTGSFGEPPQAVGTDAAELEAWARVVRKPAQLPPRLRLTTLVAVLLVVLLGAMFYFGFGR